MRATVFFPRAYLQIAHGFNKQSLSSVLLGFLLCSCGVDRISTGNEPPPVAVPKGKSSPPDIKEPGNPSEVPPLAPSLHWICGGGDQLLIGSANMGPLDTPQSIDLVEASSSRRVSPLLHPQILSANAQGAEILVLSTQSGMAELFRGSLPWTASQAKIQRLGAWKAPDFLVKLAVASSSDASPLVVHPTAEEVLVPEEKNWAIWHLPSGRKTLLPMGSLKWNRPLWSTDGNWIVSSSRNEKGRERLGIFERSSSEMRSVAPAFEDSDQFAASLSASGQMFWLEKMRNSNSEEKLILRLQHLTDRRPGLSLHEWTSTTKLQHSSLYAFDAAQRSQVGIVVKNSSGENEFFWFSVETNKRGSQQMIALKIPSPEIFQHLFWSPQTRSWLLSLKNSRGFWSFDTSTNQWRGVSIAPASQAFLCRHPAFVEVEK